MAAYEETLPSGVGRRKGTGKLHFEVRIGGEKLFSTKIRTAEEGGLCFDIGKRYNERWSESATTLGGDRGKRKAPLELNYPDYSSSLILEDFPGDLNIRDNKEGMMEIILKQARKAAKDLPERAQAAAKSRAKVQKQSAHDVGSQSIENRSSSQQKVYSLSRGVKQHPDLAGVDRSNDIRKLFDLCEHINEHMNQCWLEYNLKVIERGELERKVKDIKEDSGIISFRKSGPDKIHEHIAGIKQLVGRDGKLSPLLEAFEQKFISEESKCCKLRKILEDHNLESIPESLIGDGNKMTGRRRANENERLPPVLETCPIGELSSCIILPDVSASGGLPANPLVPDMTSSIAISSVLETDVAQPVVSFDFALGDKFPNEELQDYWSSFPTHNECRRENEDERSTEACVNSDLDWIGGLFNTDPDDLQLFEFDLFPEGSMWLSSV